MTDLNNYILPATVVIFIIHGTIKGVRVFDEFLTGAKQGIKTVFGIAPSLIALIFCVNMLRASGCLDILSSVLSPVSGFLGIPKEIVPLTLISPISGSGSVTMLESILSTYGPDSFIGLCACVMAGSTETTFYATTLYYGSVGIKNTRHTIPSALCADFTSFILSPKIVRLFFR